MNLKDQRQTIALILLAVGTLWLLVSLNVVAGAFIGVLLRYWPVLLIGVGLDILLRRPLWGLPYTALALAALLLFSLFSSPGGWVVGGRLQTLSEPLGAARAAQVMLELSSAPVSISAGAGGNLVRADIHDRGDVRLNVTGDISKTLRLERHSGPPRSGSRDARWDVALTERIPLALEVRGASGPLELNLGGVNVSTLALDLGSGSSKVTLPTTGSYAFTLDGGSGSSDISVPEGAQLSAEADLGSGAARFVIGQNSYVTLTLNSGSGPVTFTMPEGANVKLEVHNGGSNLVLPSWLERVDSGSGNEGVWQTTGFNPDGAQIVLKVEDAGSGPLTIR